MGDGCAGCNTPLYQVNFYQKRSLLALFYGHSPLPFPNGGQISHEKLQLPLSKISTSAYDLITFLEINMNGL